MAASKKTYYPMKVAGAKARREGKGGEAMPSGLTRTERAFWKLGWEEEDSAYADKN